MTDSAATQSDRRRREFTAEVGKLRVEETRGPRDRVVQVLGLVLAITGLAVGLLCYARATGFSDVRDQLQTMILALVGLGLVVIGTGLYVASTITRFLRLWLLRLVYEQRERAQD
jgi:hypothetical protein